MTPRALTEAEAALVARWAWRNRWALRLLAPVAAATAGLALVVGALAVLDGQWLGALWLGLAPAIGWVFVGAWRSTGAAGRAGSVTTRAGRVSVHRVGRSWSWRVGETPVQFASDQLRRAARDGGRVEVDVVGEAPGLVIAVRAASEGSSRTDRGPLED